jgi:Holliday junction DNA helicase RuvB
MLRRVRDFAQIKGNGTIDIAIAKYALKALNVDAAHGLDMDNKILNTIIDKFKGGPVGLSTLPLRSSVVKQRGSTRAF